MGKRKSFRKTAKVIETTFLTCISYIRGRSRRPIDEIPFPQIPVLKSQPLVKITSEEAKKIRDEEMEMLLKHAKAQINAKKDYQQASETTFYYKTI